MTSLTAEPVLSFGALLTVFLWLGGLQLLSCQMALGNYLETLLNIVYKPPSITLCEEVESGGGLIHVFQRGHLGYGSRLQ